MELVRLNKYISESGMCSRREADKYIEGGQVRINGKSVEIGVQVNPYKDKVMVNGILIEPKKDEDMIIMAFNKPVGVTTTTEKGVKDSVVDYIGYHERIFPIGRLDKDSQGLLFMTNNGDIVNKILRAGNNHEKEYVVTVDKLVTDEFIDAIGSGVPILGTMTKKCKVEKISPYVFKITLVQGMNRQIRRMCEYFSYGVVKLERIRIMNISSKGIGIGDWKILGGDELRQLMSLIADSANNDGGKSLGAGKENKSKSPKERNAGQKKADGKSRETSKSKNVASSGKRSNASISRNNSSSTKNGGGSRNAGSNSRSGNQRAKTTGRSGSRR